MDVFKELKKKKIYIEDDLDEEIDDYLSDPKLDKDSKKALSKFKQFLNDIRTKKPDDIDWKNISKKEAIKYYKIVRNFKNLHYHDNILPKLREVIGVKKPMVRWLR